MASVPRYLSSSSRSSKPTRHFWSSRSSKPTRRFWSSGSSKPTRHFWSSRFWSSRFSSYVRLPLPAHSRPLAR
ncbi:hypothetical protein ACPCBX_09300 [Streptomyces tuirus]|uniref:hypothetical protein n=1 Tax=Streptomyces tuirus TaxID=68278 RepID=UPI001684520F|nr:hypothetical protein [Streptomyces tuirus]